jgi:hypothetical protein
MTMVIDTARTDERKPRRNHDTPARTVTGTVRRYFDDKGFGFAEISGERSPDGSIVEVFLHQSYARVVTGTADEPELTRDKVDNIYVSGKGRNPDRVVMLVVPGDKGLRAIAWGKIPNRNWRVDLINGGGLDSYIGGEVHCTRDHGHSFPFPEYHGILASIELTPQRVTLKLKDAKKRDRDGLYVDNSTPEVTLTYDLEFAGPKRADYGRYSLRVSQNSYDHRITFYPPKED